MQYSLSTSDAERLAEWFLNRMSMEQRLQLMADMPLVYARVFPEIDRGSLMRIVAGALDAQDGRHADQNGRHAAREGRTPWL